MIGVANPAALALLPLLGLVVALYMLRVRRQDRAVPSVFLWRRLIQDPPANTPWQPPHRSLLMLLQLAFLGSLILALLEPFRPTEGLAGERVIVLLDRSASMAATDVHPTRLGVATRRVLELLAQVPTAQVTVIAFDDHMEVLAANESDPARLRQALSGLQARPVRGRVQDALSFAAALAEGQPRTEIVLASDGNFEPAPVAVSAPVRYVQVGSSADNQSVLGVSVSQAAGGSVEAFVRLANGSDAESTRRVETRLDGQLYDVRDVNLPAGGRASFSLPLPEGVQLVEVRLTGEDALALDDVAWAAIPAAGQARVLLVGDGNRYLEVALGLLPTVSRVTRLDPTAAGPYGLADVTVLDGVVPATLPPGNLLLIGPPSSLPGVEVLGELVAPVPQLVAPEHRLAFRELEEVAILSATALRLGRSWTPVLVAKVDGRRWPLIAEGTVEGRPAVLIAFDLRRSDLPLRTAFPLLVAETLDLLAPVSVAGFPASVAPGQMLELRLSPAVDAVTVVDPDGDRHRPEIRAGVARFSATSRLGPYWVQLETDSGRQELPFVVNLQAEEETAIRPARRLLRQATGSASGSALPGRRELWWPVGLLALGLLVAEWAYDHRAVYRRHAGSLPRWLRRRRPEGRTDSAPGGSSGGRQ